ncbi:MAG TPA: integrin alpha, partial [Phycisphaerales bacterium]|nr:integrin alpha [Phycisphaerales bacterium]
DIEWARPFPWALFDHVAVVSSGNPHEADVEALDVGAAYVYLGAPGGPAAAPVWTVAGSQAGEQFGFSVASAADANLDGYSDVMVSSPLTDLYTGGGNGDVALAMDAGFVQLFAGSSAGPGKFAFFGFYPSTVYQQMERRVFGYTIAPAGDTNGDGWPDLLMGRIPIEGSVGSARLETLASAPIWSAIGANVDDRYSAAMSAAGDVNGDGFADFIIGAPNLGSNDEGGALLYPGDWPWPAAPSWQTQGSAMDEHHGYSVAGAGDVNGDGFSDVLVGAFGYTNGEAGEGRVVAYYGGPNPTSEFKVWAVQSQSFPLTQDGENVGASVANLGDLDGNGRSELLIGCPGFDAGGKTDRGRALVYSGAEHGPDDWPAWIVDGEEAGDEFGSAVANAGDVDADGFCDAVIGAPFFSGEQPTEGRAYLFRGGDPNLLLHPTASWFAEGQQAGAHFGAAVAGAGDVNGDGFADVLVGAPAFRAGEVGEGRAFLFPGGVSGLATAPLWVIDGEQALANFGAALDTAGDVDR